MVPETESQPSQEYVDSLQRLKDTLSELECKQQSIAGGLSEPSKVEKALQQAKVTLNLRAAARKLLFRLLSSSFLLPSFRWGSENVTRREVGQGVVCGSGLWGLLAESWVTTGC